MSGSVGALLSRKFLVPVLVVGSFLAVSLAVAGAVGAQQSEQMNASWYGPGFEGATTASGEPFDPYGYTAAHKTLPFGTALEVCYQGCVTVTVNDRGPYVAGRDLDLSQGAAEAIGLTAVGHAPVTVTYLDASAPTGPASGGAAPTETQAEQPVQPAVSQQPEVADQQQAVQPQQPAVSRQQAAQPQPAARQFAQGEAAASDDQYVVEEQRDDRSVAEDQYDDSAAEDQLDRGSSSVEDQYSPPQASQPQASQPQTAEAPSAPTVEPSVPETAQLEVAPLELATPGSTVERRIQLSIAAPPENYTGALPEDPPVETVSQAQEAVPQARETSIVSGNPEVENSGVGDSGAEKPEAGSVAAAAGLTVLPDTGGLPLVPLASAALVLSLAVVWRIRR